MKNKLFFLFTATMLVTSFAFSEESQDRAVKEAVLSNHFDYARTSIEQKYHKLQQKLIKYKNKLETLEINVFDENENGMSDQFRVKKILNSIKKCEEKIKALELLQSSLEVVDVNSL